MRPLIHQQYPQPVVSATTPENGQVVSGRHTIEKLPVARNGIKSLPVESYVEIGRVMREKELAKLEMAGGGKSDKAIVPRIRRLWVVGWKALSGPR